MKTHISLRVEGIAGSHAREIAREMCELSKQLDILVVCNCNGCQMLARPSYTTEDVYADWLSWKEARCNA